MGCSDLEIPCPLHKHSKIRRVRYCRIEKYTKYKGYFLYLSDFGGLEVACWPSVPKFAGSNPAEAIGFFRAKKKNSHHAFLRKGSKAVCPMT